MARSSLVARVVFGMLLAGPALADERYPPRIRSDLHLAKDPDCQICHNGKESEKSATRPFARVMIQLGLPPSSVNVEALSAALQVDEDCKVDSDGDGVTDVEELKKGANPSDGSGDPTFSCGDGGPSLSFASAPDFQTGCSVRRFTEGSTERNAPIALLGVLAFGATRRRLRSSSHRHS
ncbi:MAG TPA: hypothetical protein VHE30_17870 [Polyangiaceae bacterium]|nr:hypothetical protein [Polyangiaceae bacterium]